MIRVEVIWFARKIVFLIIEHSWKSALNILKPFMNIELFVRILLQSVFYCYLSKCHINYLYLI